VRETNNAKDVVFVCELRTYMCEKVNEKSNDARTISWFLLFSVLSFKNVIVLPSKEQSASARN